MPDREQLRRLRHKRVKPVRLLLKHLEVTPRTSPGLWHNERGLELSFIIQRQTSNGTQKRLVFWRDFSSIPRLSANDSTWVGLSRVILFYLDVSDFTEAQKRSFLV